jgi:hypothetical protein
VEESGKLFCDKCRWERLRLLQEKLTEILHQINVLTRKNKALEEELRLSTAGREVGSRDTVPGHLKCGECLVIGGSIICNVGNECSDMKFECFPDIRTERLQRFIEKKRPREPKISRDPCMY